ncbi:flagellar biosynthesis anti-sigma factor FlgM [Desulfosoma caldarium]|uniref:Negative regulator of flagellin synthesis n=1 Tax=Desulfosoma caldarium TaxID=610254 RepID=A0A3N1VGE1_9BACT|nr:flagellar biosynthesis anti-sigma factor FlgM [Desulfosoma caldarium]ROR01906.1 FlgM family anti-sigma-28 factor [Desulfosoma caldarium]
MDVKKVATYMAHMNQVLENRTVRPEAQPTPESKTAETETVEDRVAFSQEALEMTRSRVRMDRDDLHLDKLEALRRQIQDGTYTVDPQKVAARMLDEII